MKQYKVIALSVGGRANKIFSAGDTVNEDNFIPGRADELESQGFLKSTGSTDDEVAQIPSEEIEVEVTRVDTPVESETSSILSGLKDSLGEPGESEVTIDSISKKEILKTLTELGVTFDPTASKKELFNLWLSRGNY